MLLYEETHVAVLVRKGICMSSQEMLGVASGEGEKMTLQRQKKKQVYLDRHTV